MDICTPDTYTESEMYINIHTPQLYTHTHTHERKDTNVGIMIIK